MPVIVNEIVFRGEIAAPVEARPAAAPPSRPQDAGDERRALVQECVEQVLRLIERRKER